MPRFLALHLRRWLLQPAAWLPSKRADSATGHPAGGSPWGGRLAAVAADGQHPQAACWLCRIWLTAFNRAFTEDVTMSPWMAMPV